MAIFHCYVSSPDGAHLVSVHFHAEKAGPDLDGVTVLFSDHMEVS